MEIRSGVLGNAATRMVFVVSYVRHSFERIARRAVVQCHFVQALALATAEENFFALGRIARHRTSFDIVNVPRGFARRVKRRRHVEVPTLHLHVGLRVQV